MAQPGRRDLGLCGRAKHAQSNQARYGRVRWQRQTQSASSCSEQRSAKRDCTHRQEGNRHRQRKAIGAHGRPNSTLPAHRFKVTRNRARTSALREPAAPGIFGAPTRIDPVTCDSQSAANSESCVSERTAARDENGHIQCRKYAEQHNGSDMRPRQATHQAVRQESTETQ